MSGLKKVGVVGQRRVLGRVGEGVLALELLVPLRPHVELPLATGGPGDVAQDAGVAEADGVHQERREQRPGEPALARRELLARRPEGGLERVHDGLGVGWDLGVLHVLEDADDLGDRVVDVVRERRRGGRWRGLVGRPLRLGRRDAEVHHRRERLLDRRDPALRSRRAPRRRRRGSSAPSAFCLAFSAALSRSAWPLWLAIDVGATSSFVLSPSVVRSLVYGHGDLAQRLELVEGLGVALGLADVEVLQEVAPRVAVCGEVAVAEVLQLPQDALEADHLGLAEDPALVREALRAVLVEAVADVLLPAGAREGAAARRPRASTSR